MNTITVVIKTPSFECAKNQMITGVIFFDFINFQFPEKNWNDFVIIILNWWLSALTRMVSGFSESETLQFMDGPFFIRLKKTDGNICTIECIDERKSECLEFSGQFQFDKVVKNVLQVAKATYSFCCKNSWEGDDVNELKQNIKSFPTR